MMACTGPAPNPTAKLAREEVLAARAAVTVRDESKEIYIR
jgi:hypothetical protein